MTVGSIMNERSVVPHELMVKMSVMAEIRKIWRCPGLVYNESYLEVRLL